MADLSARYLVDKSALERMPVDAVRARLAPLIETGAAATCSIVIAAAAEAAGLTVLHYDADFDRIAGVTGQPVEWVVPRGSA